MAVVSDSIDRSLAEIRQFIQKELVDTLSGQDGHFEPMREWAIIVKNVAVIQAAEHALPEPERKALTQAIDRLQECLNIVVDILRDAVTARLGGTSADSTYLARINEAIRLTDEGFAEEIRRYYVLRRKSDSSGNLHIGNYHQYVGEVHMGDVFQGISNSTIVSRSKVEGAFNRLQDSGQNESAKLLIEIGKRVSDANNAAAGAVYSQMAEELSKPTHDKGVLRSCWDGLVAILPPLATLSAEVIKAFVI